MGPRPREPALVQILRQIAADLSLGKRRAAEEHKVLPLQLRGEHLLAFGQKRRRGGILRAAAEVMRSYTRASSTSSSFVCAIRAICSRLSMLRLLFFRGIVAVRRKKAMALGFCSEEDYTWDMQCSKFERLLKG